MLMNYYFVCLQKDEKVNVIQSAFLLVSITILDARLHLAKLHLHVKLEYISIYNFTFMDNVLN